MGAATWMWKGWQGKGTLRISAVPSQGRTAGAGCRPEAEPAWHAPGLAAFPSAAKSDSKKGELLGVPRKTPAERRRGHKETPLCDSTLDQEDGISIKKRWAVSAGEGAGCQWSPGTRTQLSCPGLSPH